MTAHRRGGLWLMLAAAAFWLAWVMMPDAGTNDAVYILETVRTNRESVWWSAVIHLLTSIAFVAAVVGIQSDRRASESASARIGACFVLVGALGVCADAFFHLMAYYLTADGVDAAAVKEPMRLLQTQGVAFLAPLLLALVPGGWMYAAGLRRAGAITCVPWWLFVLAVGSALVGGVAVVGTGQARQGVVLWVLGVVALGYGWIGYDLAVGTGVGGVASDT